MSIQAGLKERAYAMAEMARTPEQIKAVQRHLSQAIQDQTLPSYVGIPLISELNQRMATVAMPQAAPAQQPPIAQQVLAQAQADQGVPALPSGLPTEMAGGGIVAFAGGGETDRRMIEALLGKDDEESDEDYDEMVDALSSAGQSPDLSGIMKLLEEYQSSKPDEQPSSLPSLGEIPKITVRERPGVTEVEKTDGNVAMGIAPVEAEDRLLSHVLAKESGGRRYDKAGNLLTSPKGAEGEMQVMPGTQRDPGFGVIGARDRSPEEIARVGRDYLKALRQRYGDDKLAAIAYNWGPGNTDKWLMAGADPARLPAETRNYITGMAGGGIVSFAGGALVPYASPAVSSLDPWNWASRGAGAVPSSGGIFDISPEAQRMRDEAARRLRAEQLRETFGTRAAAGAAPAAEGAAAAGAAESGLSGLWNAIKSGASRLNPRGISAWSLGAYHPELNANEEEELAKRWAPAAAPAATTGVSPAPAPAAAAPSKKSVITLPPTGAGAGRGVQGGPSYADLEQQAKEEEYAANQEASDLEEGRAMERMAKEKAEEGKKQVEGKEEPKSKLEQLLEARMARMDKQRDEDKYLALLSAGLGMMSGTSPFALTNIGQGAQAGIASYLKSGATRAAEENAIMSGQLGLERYKQLADIRKQGIEGQRALKEMELGLRERIAEGQAGSKAEALQLRQQKMYQDRLAQIERLAQTQALAEYKGALLPEQKDQILAQATNSLRNDPGYRELYKKVHGFDPSPRVLTYDPSSRSLR